MSRSHPAPGPRMALSALKGSLAAWLAPLLASLTAVWPARPAPQLVPVRIRQWPRDRERPYR